MRRPPSRNALVSLALGTVLGLLSFGLTSYQPLWKLVHASGDVSATLGVGLSVIILLLGFLFALYFQQSDYQDELRRAIPNLTLFTVSSGDEAMHQVSRLFSSARMVLNTRIFSGDFNPTANPGHSHWDKRLRSAVRDGLTFREVASAGNLDLVCERKRVTEGGSGLYDAVIVDYNFESFLNFVLLEFRDGTKELWFGWLVSPGAGFEQHVVHTTEKQIVQMFETWHRDLYTRGRCPWPPDDVSLIETVH
jgi:hypothetical protein